MTRRNAYCSFCRKSYTDVGPLVEGPGDVYICGECVELCQSIIDQEKRRRAVPGPGRPGPTADELRQALGRLLPNQDEAVRAVAVAACRHYERGGPSPKGAGGLLLVGPTQSSKIYLARALARTVGVPFAHGEAGAPGPLLDALLQASDFDVEAAGTAVVYVDGADRREAQRPLRELLGGAAAAPAAHGLTIDTSGVFFLCGGRFEGLDEFVARAGRHPEQPLTGEGLLAFGMPADLVRRFGAVVRLAALDEETLVRVVSGEGAAD